MLYKSHLKKINSEELIMAFDYVLFIGADAKKNKKQILNNPLLVPPVPGGFFGRGLLLRGLLVLVEVRGRQGHLRSEIIS